MNLNIAICDDDPQQIQIISSYITTYEIEYDNDFRISAYSSTGSLLDAYNKPGVFHIIFLDVEMPDMSGLCLAEKIRSIPDRKVKIIFISNYPEYMQESFEVQAFHYIKKPVSYEQFKRIMNRIIDEFTENTFQRLIINNGECSELIEHSDILYFETVKNERNRLRIVLNNGERNIKGALSTYEALLKNNAFFSPHRSYIVNLRHVHLIKKDSIILDNNMEIPLSRRRERSMKELFTRQILSIYKNQY